MSQQKAVVDCLDCAPSTEPKPAAIKPEPDLDIMNPSTFSPPVLSVGQEEEELPRIVIEFCDRCRWLHRAVWTQTELFLTFPPTSTTSDDGVTTSSGIKAITLLPRSAPETGGRFRVWLYRYRTLEQEFEESKGKEKWDGAELIWDRKIEGGFPELKDLKQRVRNYIAPKKNLGHSDSKDKKDLSSSEETPSKEEQVLSYEPSFRC